MHCCTSQQCDNVEDVAEIIGEISESLNSSCSSVFLKSFDNIKNCFHSCLNPLEKLSWINTFSIIEGKILGCNQTFEDYDVTKSDEEESNCQLISIIRSLIGHLRDHSLTSDVTSSMHVQVKPLLNSSLKSEYQQIIFESQYFTLPFLKYCGNTACHNCDVATVFLCILSRYFEGKKCDFEDIYSNNSNGGSIDFSTYDDEDYTTCNASMCKPKKLSGACLSSGANCFDVIGTSQNQKYKTSGTSAIITDDVNQESSLASSMFVEESGCLFSEMNPVKVDQISSESHNNECLSMPPNLGRKEEERKSVVFYGNMERVLEFLKEDVKNWISSGKSRIIGIILHKYKKIIKIKNDSYDEGIHFIKVTSSSLGTGCSGKCYLAVDNSSKHAFCLKTVKLFKSSEIEVWASLTGIKGIPKFYGILFNADYAYILQEFIHGPTLQSLITQSESRMEIRLSLKILNELLLTLSQLHQRNVIHNDVKADNIILGSRQVLLDFGLSVQSFYGVKEGVDPCGSQCHWSPEKAASEKYGVKSDVWAAIVVFVHMISGVEPWLKRFKNSKALHFIIKTMSPPLEDVPKNLPDDILDLIKRGWTIDAILRASAEELLEHRAFKRLEASKLEPPELGGLLNIFRGHDLESIMSDQLQKGQELLLRLPNKIKELNDIDICDVQDGSFSSLRNDSLTVECTEVLDLLASVPSEKLQLSKEVSEELQMFLKNYGDDDDGGGAKRIESLKISKAPDKIIDESHPLRCEMNSNLKIPVTVEEHFVSSEDSEEDIGYNCHETSEALAVVLLEDGTQIYSCKLSPGSATTWSDVAKRCSTDVHSRNIPRFYLTLYPSGRHINALENVMDTITRESDRSTNTRWCPSLSSGSRKEVRHLHNSSQKIIKAMVIEIQSDVQSWSWKVENNSFSICYGSLY